jgi:hypothetical protein
VLGADTDDVLSGVDKKLMPILAIALPREVSENVKASLSEIVDVMMKIIYDGNG